LWNAWAVSQALTGRWSLDIFWKPAGFHETERGCVVLDQPQHMANTTVIVKFNALFHATRCG
jgi:hypothetical protein